MGNTTFVFFTSWWWNKGYVGFWAVGPPHMENVTMVLFFALSMTLIIQLLRLEDFCL